MKSAQSRTLDWFHKQMLISGSGPARIDIVTGWGKHFRVTATVIVKKVVECYLCLVE